MIRSFKSTALLVSGLAFACVAADAPAAKAAPAASAAPAAAPVASSVKIEPATPAASPAKAAPAAPTAPVAAAAAAGTSCEEVKASIDAKLKAKGVKTFTLDIVANADVKDAKVVGSCEAGSKKITYKRG